jgi:Tfp pilus assembly protein PilO
VKARLRRFDVREIAPAALLVLGAILVIDLVVAIGVVRPQGVRLDALRRDSEPRLNALKQRRAFVEGTEGFLGKLRQAEADLGKLRSEILSTRDRRMIETQLEVEKLAGQFGVDFDEIRFENDILKEQGVDRFGMVVPLRGGYRNLRKFIQAVESSPRFLVIEKVSLGSGDKGTEDRLELKITLATYFDVPDLFREPLRRAARRS